MAEPINSDERGRDLLETIPVDAWGEKYATRLVGNIDTHLAVLTDGLTEEERYSLRRMIMITVREWAQDTFKEINNGKEPSQEHGQSARTRQ